MKFRKSISLVLVASQFGMGTLLASASPIPAASSAQSPEYNLVENVIALQGQKLSPEDEQNRVNALVTQYLSTVQAKAQADGAQQRFEQALIDLHVYSAQQAQSFVADAEAASSRIIAAKPSASDQAQNLISGEVSQLASLHPAGAQFSSGILCDAGEYASLGGALVVLTGLYLRLYNPTCSTPTWEETTCGEGGCYESTISGPTTCTDGHYHPDAQIGDDVMIGGAVVLGVGALVWFLNRNSDGC